MNHLETKINHLLNLLNGEEDSKKRKTIEKELIKSGELFSVLGEVKQLIEDKKIQETDIRKISTTLRIDNFKEKLGAIHEKVFFNYNFEIICYLLILELYEKRLTEEERNALAVQMLEFCMNLEREIFYISKVVKEKTLRWKDEVFPIVLYFSWPKWDSFKKQLFRLNSNQKDLILNYQNYVNRGNKTIQDFFDIDSLSKDSLRAYHIRNLQERSMNSNEFIPESDLEIQELRTEYLSIAKTAKSVSQISDWFEFLATGYDSILLELFHTLSEYSVASYFAKLFLENETSKFRRNVSHDLLTKIETLLDEKDQNSRILLAELTTRNEKDLPPREKTLIKLSQEYRKSEDDSIRKKLIDSLIRASSYSEAMQVILEVKDNLPPLNKVKTLIEFILNEEDSNAIFEELEFDAFIDEIQKKVDAIDHDFYAPRYKIDFLDIQSLFLRCKKELDSQVKKYPSDNLEFLKEEVDKVHSIQEIGKKIESYIYLFQKFEKYSMNFEKFINLENLKFEIQSKTHDFEFKIIDKWVLQFNKLGLNKIVQLLLEIKLKKLFKNSLETSPLMVWEEISSKVESADSNDSKVNFYKTSFLFYIKLRQKTGDVYTEKFASIAENLYKLDVKLGKKYLIKTFSQMKRTDFQGSETLEIIGRIIYEYKLTKEYGSFLEEFVTDELELEAMISVALVIAEAMVNEGRIEDAFNYLKEEIETSYNSYIIYSSHDEEWYHGKRLYIFELMGKKEEGIEFFKSYYSYYYTDEEINEIINLYREWREEDIKKKEIPQPPLKPFVELSVELSNLNNSLDENSTKLEKALIKCLTSIALSGFAKECMKFIREEFRE